MSLRENTAAIWSDDRVQGNYLVDAVIETTDWEGVPFSDAFCGGGGIVQIQIILFYFFRGGGIVQIRILLFPG